MKRGIFFTGFWALLIAFSLVRTSTGQDYYEKGRYRLIRSHYADSLVAGVNVKQLAARLFPDFSMISEQGESYYGRTYLFRRDSDQMRISVNVGVYPSIEEAEEQMLGYLNFTYAVFHEGAIAEIEVGDNSWFSLQGSIYQSVAFIRKNAKIRLSTTSRYTELVDLAKAVDADLMKGASYIAFEDTPSPPLIHSVNISKNQIKENETSTFTILASDPRGKKLYYSASGGANDTLTEPPNVFLVTASKATFGNDLFGVHSFSFWVMNEDNLFSRKVTAQITF